MLLKLVDIERLPDAVADCVIVLEVVPEWDVVLLAETEFESEGDIELEVEGDCDAELEWDAVPVEVADTFDVAEFVGLSLTVGDADALAEGVRLADIELVMESDGVVECDDDFDTDTLAVPVGDVVTLTVGEDDEERVADVEGVFDEVVVTVAEPVTVAEGVFGERDLVGPGVFVIEGDRDSVALGVQVEVAVPEALGEADHDGD